MPNRRFPFLIAAAIFAVSAVTVSAFPVLDLQGYLAGVFARFAPEGVTDSGVITSTLVINEIDYDQVGADSAEFLELKNVSGGLINLDTYTIELVNGNLGGAVVYDTIGLPNVNLAAGDYYVICANAATVPNCDLDDGPDTGFIQNGSPDAVGLRDSGVLVDAVSYEGDTGAPYTENAGTPVVTGSDSDTVANLGLSRFADGSDTDNNSVDVTLRCITPGTVNVSGAASCPAPVVVPVHIREIQGATHISPLNTTSVSNVPGIVTAKTVNGFYMQDPNPDANDATSEGIFVFTSSAPTVNVGDSVTVAGTVAEFRPSGDTNNLTTTEITLPTIILNSTGNVLPAPIVIGTGGRIPPTDIIEDDASGNVETSGVFDPTVDGIDFYESLEGMYVQVNNPVAVGIRNTFGEIAVLGDDGANASVRSLRGGIVIRSTDFNPERIVLDDQVLAGSTPVVNVSDHFSASALGVMDYSAGMFKLQLTQPLVAISGGLAAESTTPQGPHELAVATFNMENLDPGDGAKFAQFALQIVNNLRSPDIIAVQEIEDNNGPTNDSTVDASTTFNTLITAIATAGGPPYSFRQIDPVDDSDGGEPGGNIRVGFLFRTDRDLVFLDQPGGGPTVATTVVNNGGVPELSSSPGRIDPANLAFTGSRKPLVGEFVFNGTNVFVIGNHFNSKGGDQPLFGRFQPPTLSSETQRTQQAQIVNDFVDSILAIDANANIIVLGDLNDFEFSNPLNTLKGGVLHNLTESLPQNERYTFIFEGNSETFEHILLSNSLFAVMFQHDIVHIAAEFAIQTTDHDPQVVRLPIAPTAAGISIGGRVLTASGQGIRNASVTIVGGSLSQPMTVRTGTFGYYNFDDLQPGTTYVISVAARKFLIANPVRSVTVTDNIAGLDFIADLQE